MKSVKDPVCGMVIDSEAAAGSSTYEEQVYYFCSTECKREFDRNPKKYVEPRFTKTGPIVAPKFGSATSGGGEYEPSPDEDARA
jgi:YHS domain-containing protein